jgi:hypothetical protein
MLYDNVTCRIVIVKEKTHKTLIILSTYDIYYIIETGLKMEDNGRGVPSLQPIGMAGL